MTEDNHLMFRTEGILKNLHSRSKIILSGSQKDSTFLSKASFQEGPTSHPFSASSFSGVRSSVIELSSFSKNAVNLGDAHRFFDGGQRLVGCWFPTECTFF